MREVRGGALSLRFLPSVSNVAPIMPQSRGHNGIGVCECESVHTLPARSAHAAQAGKVMNRENRIIVLPTFRFGQYDSARSWQLYVVDF